MEHHRNSIKCHKFVLHWSDDCYFLETERVWVSRWRRCGKEWRVGENPEVEATEEAWQMRVTELAGGGPSLPGWKSGSPIYQPWKHPEYSVSLSAKWDNSTSQCTGLLSGFNELAHGLVRHRLFTHIGCFHTALWKGFGLPQAMELGEIRQFLPELKVKRSSPMRPPLYKRRIENGLWI